VRGGSLVGPALSGSRVAGVDRPSLLGMIWPPEVRSAGAGTGSIEATPRSLTWAVQARPSQ
jgi:hypothetical protein